MSCSKAKTMVAQSAEARIQGEKIIIGAWTTTMRMGSPEAFFVRIAIWGLEILKTTVISSRQQSST